MLDIFLLFPCREKKRIEDSSFIPLGDWGGQGQPSSGSFLSSGVVACRLSAVSKFSNKGVGTPQLAVLGERRMTPTAPTPYLCVREERLSTTTNNPRLSTFDVKKPYFSPSSQSSASQHGAGKRGSAPLSHSGTQPSSTLASTTP